MLPLHFSWKGEYFSFHKLHVLAPENKEEYVKYNDGWNASYNLAYNLTLYARICLIKPFGIYTA